jgi:hypothetical protein
MSQAATQHHSHADGYAFARRELCVMIGDCENIACAQVTTSLVPVEAEQQLNRHRSNYHIISNSFKDIFHAVFSIAVKFNA